MVKHYRRDPATYSAQEVQAYLLHLVKEREAWNTSKSAHGPWRLSKTPALNLALPAKLFRQMGLPELAPVKAA